MMIVAVTGWRHHTDETFIRAQMDRLYFLTDEQIWLRVGDAEGADAIATQWAKDQFIPHDIYIADWNRHQKLAGPLRNRQMLTMEKIYEFDGATSFTLEPLPADLLVAFPEPGARPKIPGSGSWGCIGEAFTLGIEVLIPGYSKGL